VYPYNDKLVAMEHGMRVAFLGQAGSNSEEAAIEYYGTPIVAVHCDSFTTICDALARGDADEAMLPIENSVAGSIHSNYDILLRYDFQIVGEFVFRVRNNLLALPGVALGDVKRVLSHPQPLAQCSEYLSRLGVALEVTSDTTVAARRVRAELLTDTAAIASKRAAVVYDLAVLAADIEDDAENYTRFIVLSREARPAEGDQTLKTSIVFAVAHQPGALTKALAAFSDRGLNLMKIESRPLRGRPWEYLFYLDFVGQDQSDEALRVLGEQTTMLRVLGRYPSYEERVIDRPKSATPLTVE
jgi:prephenate dehydratase